MALHDESDHLFCRCGCTDCNFESAIVGTVGLPNIHHLYFSQLDLQSRTTSHCSYCLLPLVTSSSVTSRLQSWDGGTPRLSPPVALALQVCDRESLRNGCLLHVLLLSILCLQIISDRTSCLEIAALPRSFTSSNNCFDRCEAQRHCIPEQHGLPLLLLCLYSLDTLKYL